MNTFVQNKRKDKTEDELKNKKSELGKLSRDIAIKEKGVTDKVSVFSFPSFNELVYIKKRVVVNHFTHILIQFNLLLFFWCFIFNMPISIYTLLTTYLIKFLLVKLEIPE